MKRLPIMVIGVGLLAAACGSAGPGSLGPAPAGITGPSSPASAPGAGTAGAAQSPAGRQPATPATSAPGSPGEIGLQVWFTRNGKLVVAERTIPATTSVGAAAVDRLLAGP
jgi:hypothetical protein